MRLKTPLLFICIAVISGCSAFRTGLKEYDLNETGPGTVQKRLDENYGGIRSLSGRFDFSYSTESDRKQSSAFIYLTPGDTLYIEIKGLVGETEAVVFIDKDSLKAVNYFEKVSVREKSGENSIRRMTGMDLGVSDLRKALLSYTSGTKPVKVTKNDGKSLTVRVEEDEKRYQFITLDPRLLVTSADGYEEREIRYKAEYDYFSKENGKYFPRRIRIRTFNPPSKLTIFFNSLKINKFTEIKPPVRL
jgi:outer membrane biogenesis lipoprotein LolB